MASGDEDLPPSPTSSTMERLATPVDSVYLQKNFVTEREEAYLLSRVRSQSATKWKTLSGRRLQNWGGQPHDKGMILEPIPDFLQAQLDRIEGACAEFVKLPMVRRCRFYTVHISLTPR